MTVVFQTFADVVDLDRYDYIGFNANWTFVSVNKLQDSNRTEGKLTKPSLPSIVNIDFDFY